MAILSHKQATGFLIIATLGFAPLGVAAQDATGTDPAGIFAFSGLGTTAVDELPFEIAAETRAPAPLPPLAVTDLGVTPAAPVIEPDNSERVMSQTVWTIGVYR